MPATRNYREISVDSSFFFFFILAAVGIRVALHFVDKSRIRRELESRGGRVLSIKWNPFARGWFGEKGERHYDIMFRDRSGNDVSTTCKTSLLTGIYWAEGPTLAEESRRFQQTPRCLGCGYALNAEWKFCPNCAKHTSVA